MATKNLVPRANNEGSIGLADKKWADANFSSGSFDTLKTNNLQTTTGNDLIQNDDGQNAVRKDSDTGIYYISGGGSSEADKIVKGDTTIVAYDNGTDPSKIEIKVDDTLFWTVENDGDFIPTSTNNPDIGSSTNKVQKLFLNSGTDSGISIGNSLLLFSKLLSLFS